MTNDPTAWEKAPNFLPTDWSAWLDEYGPRLMLYARQQTHSLADAEDVMQEAVVQLVRVVESGRFEGGVEQYASYVLSAIRHRAADVGRRRKARYKYEQMDADSRDAVQENPWLHSEHDDDLYRRHVERILRRMPADYAEILLLKLWEDLTHQQIAEVTGEAVSTVYARYRRALERFREELAEDPLPE
ncbi:MAG: sigma-70 family RNA polymerase sigma factor [Akkermansia sp.]|nr:sigma-70 family RNA polymerase sigma factor [Akkermansia sp.]